MQNVMFRGASGRMHRFSAHRPDEAFPQQPAVYCFARPAPDGRGMIPLFLSRTANLGARLAAHESWPEARLLGATHILVHQREERDVREFVEADLMVVLKPVMNGALLDADEIEGFEEDEVAPRMVWAA